MILNGKALENFYSWWENKIKNENFQYFKPREDVYLNALIVQWFDSIGLWEQEFYEVYIESTPTTEFKQIIEKTIINLNKKYNEGIK